MVVWCKAELSVLARNFAFLQCEILFLVVRCTLAVTYGSSLNIAPWPHCTIPLFITAITITIIITITITIVIIITTITIITIITISLFITITIKMNRPVLLEDFQASAG